MERVEKEVPNDTDPSPLAKIIKVKNGNCFKISSNPKLKRSKSVTFNEKVQIYDSPEYHFVVDLDNEYTPRIRKQRQKKQGWLSKGFSFLFTLADTIQWCSHLLTDHYSLDGIFPDQESSKLKKIVD